MQHTNAPYAIWESPRETYARAGLTLTPEDRFREALNLAALLVIKPVPQESGNGPIALFRSRSSPRLDVGPEK
jgi:hypothetical protein